MKTSQLTISTQKKKGSWMLKLGGAFNGRVIHNIQSKECAQSLSSLFKEVFQAGKYAEFKENLRRAKTTMRQWGL